jgi:hypothetical protein
MNDHHLLVRPTYHGAMPATSSTPSRPGWLLLDSRRSLATSTAAILLAAPVVLVLVPAVSDDGDARTVFGVVVAWALFNVLHTVATWWAFRGSSGDELRRLVTVETARLRREQHWYQRLSRSLLGNIGAASWSVQISGMALLAVLVLVLTPSLRQQPALLVMVLVMVVMSWANVAVTYALHYARLDLDGAESRLLGFPGVGQRTFSDYLYVALGVQTAFTTSDVELRTAEIRRVVMGHGVLAFAFNSVIIAVLVSLLVGSA